MNVEELREQVRAVVEDRSLTYRQRVQRLALEAENVLEPPPVSGACAEALDKRIICDLYEGNAPWRPRYTLPDYERLFATGSAFLELDPPSALDEALTTLLCVYGNVPSITGYPVWFGDLDRLLEPFAAQVSDAGLRRALRLFWVALDRLFPDAFAHANLGPDDGRVVRAALAVHRETTQTVPNLTLRVDPARTPESLLLDAIGTVFVSAQPHLANHPAMVRDLGERYGVVSCYNSLPVGGGSHTLARLNLLEVARRAPRGSAGFFDDALPRYAELLAELMEARIRHLVERAGFFEHSWLVHEGLLSLDRFTAMFGVVGLAEAVATLLDADGTPGRFGHDARAGELAVSIVERLHELVAARPMPYCEASGGRALLHAQAGLEADSGFSAGCRIPVGEEPSLVEHLLAVAPLHAHFPTGISDIVQLDDTAQQNPRAVVDLVRGAFAAGMREFTFNVDANGFVRITGYLARKSDLTRAARAEAVRHSSTVLGAGAVEHAHVDRRTPRRVVAAELGAPR